MGVDIGAGAQVLGACDVPLATTTTKTRASGARAGSPQSKSLRVSLETRC